MRRADLGDVDLKRRMLADEDSCGSGVVEVDVREQEMAHLREREAALAQPGLQRRNARRRPAVEESGTVRRLQQVAADDARRLVVEVDRPEHAPILWIG